MAIIPSNWEWGICLFLQPASQLRSRLVLIRGCKDPDAFLDAAIRQLKALSIQGQVQL